jgi:hypothetical protein
MGSHQLVSKLRLQIKSYLSFFFFFLVLAFGSVIPTFLLISCVDFISMIFTIDCSCT